MTKSPTMKLYRPEPSKTLPQSPIQSYTGLSGGTTMGLPNKRNTLYEVQRANSQTYMLSTPMARMRDLSTQVANSLDDNTQAKSPKAAKSQEQIKKEKQQKWKRQMKRAQKQKMREQQALEGGLSPRVADGRGLMDIVLNEVERNNFFALFRVQCGGLGDVVSESDSSIAESSTADSSETGRRSESSQSAGIQTPVGSPPRRQKPNDPKSPESRLGTGRVYQRRVSSLEYKTPPRDISSPRSSVKSPSSVSFLTPGSKTPVSAGTADGHLSPRLPPRNIDNLSLPQLSRQALQQHGKLQPKPENPTSWKNQQRITTPSSAVHPGDKSFVKAFIAEAINDGFAMLWHKEKVSMKPAQVSLRLQSGRYQVSSKIHLGPRLVWSDGSGDGFGFSLFQIRSLERAKPGHLEEYPFAIPGRSIFLKLLDSLQVFVFEANSEDEAWRFVHGLRWVIARFSFNLVIGNVDVSCELLDVGVLNKNGTKPSTLFEVIEREKAMDDITEQFVDSLVPSGIRLKKMAGDGIFPPEPSTFPRIM